MITYDMICSFDICDFNITTNSTNKKFVIGTTWINTRGETFNIIGYSSKQYKTPQGIISYPYVIIEFANGYKKEVSIHSIRTKEVKNEFFPLIENVGFMGLGPHKSVINGKHTKEYKLWTGMLRRCYNKKELDKNPTYRGCTVAPRWHNFQNFCEDIQFLEGYAEWKASSNTDKRNKYDLDKDTKVLGNKLYASETCRFITYKDNTTFSSLTGLTYIGFNKEKGLVINFCNQAEFCRTHKLTPTNVTKAIKGKVKSHKGWTFKIKEENK